jgi:hypothetical protein
LVFSTAVDTFSLGLVPIHSANYLLPTMTITSKSPFTIVRVDNHRFVYWRGKLIYKQWLAKDGVTHTQPSIIINHNGWPNEWVV